jgi:hypothetical protein
MIIHPPSIYHIIDDLSQIVIDNLLARRVLINTKESTAKEKKRKMEAPRRTASQKRLAPNQRVSGAVGDFIEGGPTKRRRRERLFGHIIAAVGEKRYLVRFDNGQEKECPSNILKVESSAASIPPDIPLPARQENLASVTAIMENEADVQDIEETEDLPAVRPEEEDAEVLDELNGGEAKEANERVAAVNKPDGANENIHDPNGRMPGQLPKAADAVQKDYHSIKKAAKEKIAALVGTEVSVVTKKMVL